MKKLIRHRITAGLSIITGIGILFLATAGLLLFLPRLFAITPYIVMSGSMEPAIHTGGIVYVNTKETVIRPRDVITFRMSDRLVTHRVLRVEDGRIYTKGDANGQEDPNPAEKNQVIGKVILSLPYLGYLAIFIQSKRGAAALLFLLLSHMVCRDIRYGKEQTAKGEIENLKRKESGEIRRKII